MLDLEHGHRHAGTLWTISLGTGVVEGVRRQEMGRGPMTLIGHHSLANSSMYLRVLFSASKYLFIKFLAMPMQTYSKNVLLFRKRQ